MNKFFAQAAALSAASVVALALSVGPTHALAAPVHKGGVHRHAEQKTAPSPDAVAMAEADPRCETEAPCPATPEDVVESVRCPEDGDAAGAEGCPKPSAPPSRPSRVVALGSALGGLMLGPVPVKVVGVILSQPGVSERITRAACGLLGCKDHQAKE